MPATVVPWWRAAAALIVGMKPLARGGSAEGPVGRSEMKYSIEGIEALGVRLKAIKRTSDAYAAALLSAAGAWSALCGELSLALPELALVDQGEQVRRV
eukprot:COSAG01_NODE_10327_length_2192_cov_5.359771_5_plen_99_part_00